jgi:hypothetical protein
MYTAIRTGAVEAAVFVGGSNALNLAYSASALGLDAYQLAKGGWKLTKENVDKIIPDTAVVLFCLDNSCFMGLADDGSMTHISSSIEGDDGFHVQGALVVAPERALKNSLEQKKRLIEACGTHLVLIISPWPRFVRSPCCSELEHTTNFAEPDFLKTIIADLNRLRYQLRKLVSPATVLDGLELICGHGYNKEKVSQVIQAGWGHDPVHPNKHIYAKMALNLMERMAAVKTEATSTSSRKRTWSSTNSDASGSSSHFGGGGGASSGGGGGGRPTHRSSSWRENHNRQESGYQGGFGDRFGDQYAGHGNAHGGDGGGRFQGGGGGDSRYRSGYSEQYGRQYGHRGGRR